MSIVAELRYAARGARRNPVSSAVVVVTIAVTLASTASVFGLAFETLLGPLPYPSSSRLLRLHTRAPGGRPVDVPLHFTSLLRDRARTLDRVEAFAQQDVSIRTGNEVSELRMAEATAGLLPLFGARPILGRVFSDEEEDAAVISYELWESRFSKDPQVIGKQIIVAGQVRSVIGVLPNSFAFQPAILVWRRTFSALASQLSSQSSRLNSSMLSFRRKPGQSISVSRPTAT